MKIKLKVKTRAKQDRVERVAEGSYKVWVKAAPEKGKANEAVVKALSEHFGIARAGISIVSGYTSAAKTARIGVDS